MLFEFWLAQEALPPEKDDKIAAIYAKKEPTEKSFISIKKRPPDISLRAFDKAKINALRTEEHDEHL